MLDSDGKADLHRYLQDAREALLWKLEGLSEYDVRRPLVPTGTNLLGLVKHVTGGRDRLLRRHFGRPSADQLPWDESDPMSDMFAVPEESRESLTGLYRRAWAHSDATIDALPLDAIGHVPWWPADRNQVTLHHVLVRVATETSPPRRPRRPRPRAHRRRPRLDRHPSNLPPGDQPWWQAHHDRVEPPPAKPAIPNPDREEHRARAPRAGLSSSRVNPVR